MMFVYHYNYNTFFLSHLFENININCNKLYFHANPLSAEVFPYKCITGGGF